MFESAELGRSVTKKEFKEAEDELRTALLAAQWAIRAAEIPVIVIVSGVEGAGKGSVVNQLTTWMDVRGMRVHVFWEETDEERERPIWWRFWRTLPPRGTVGVLFGSWYTKPIVDHALQRARPELLRVALHEINAVERMLTLDGALLVKLWFHLSKKDQRLRFDADGQEKQERWQHSPLTETYGSQYDAFAHASEQAIRATVNTTRRLGRSYAGCNGIGVCPLRGL